MTVSDNRLKRDLELLRHGGAEAVVLFLERAQEFYGSDGPDALSSWVTVASPALPEVDRHAAITVLFRLILTGDGTAEMQEEHHTLQ
jgi:hypothetical protein